VQLAHNREIAQCRLFYLFNIKLKVKKNAEALQTLVTLHKHYNSLETMETTPRIYEFFDCF